MPEYVNPNSYAVHLTGPDGNTIRIGGGGRKNLSEYFDRYCGKGYLRKVEHSNSVLVQDNLHPTPHKQAKTRRPKTNTNAPAKTIHYAQTTKQTAQRRQKQTQTRQVQTRRISPPKKIVGKVVHGDATQQLVTNLKVRNYPISNNIGVGILSYNRPASLYRLLESISRFTNLNRTTIFISDDNSTNPEIEELLSKIKQTNSVVVLDNKTRIGIAGNTNRLLRCLSRFRYGLLLNDDVEVLNHGWEQFYPDIMRQCGFHQFCFRQPGVYGAKDGTRVVHNGIGLSVVQERPHGAVLAFTNDLFSKIGYFDEAFGLYGMEHVDWSARAQHTGLQPIGFYDAAGSNKFFKLYAESSVVEDRQNLLNQSRKIFSTKDPKRGFVQATPISTVPVVTCVIPCRNSERHGGVETVINNIRAQRFPQIQMVVVEHDTKSVISKEVYPFQYRLVLSEGRPFNKSKAFNAGIALADNEKIILHDADIVVGGDYAATVSGILDNYEACHIGKHVLYVNRESTAQITQTGIIDDTVSCERIVGYFEGGSLGCRRNTYWRVGGFNEDFEGWGVEDCEFYQRLANNCLWLEDRNLDFFHLWHGRVQGWEHNHATNKELERGLSAKPMAVRINSQYEQLRRNGYAKYLP